MPMIIKRDAFEEALGEKGFTLNQLALYTKISKSYLSQLKNGKRNPSPKTIEKILKVLKGYKRSDIFEWIPRNIIKTAA